MNKVKCFSVFAIEMVSLVFFLFGHFGVVNLTKPVRNEPKVIFHYEIKKKLCLVEVCFRTIKICFAPLQVFNENSTFPPLSFYYYNVPEKLIFITVLWEKYIVKCYYIMAVFYYF